MPRPRPRRCAAWGLAGLALVVAGCGGGGRADVATPPTSESARAVAPAASATTEAPAADLLSFTAPAIGGGEVDLASFRGRPTLLWFWAPW